MKMIFLALSIVLVTSSASAQGEWMPSGFGQPQIAFTQRTYDFNAQPLGNPNCVNLPLVNQTDRPRIITALRTNLSAFTISSPAEEMLPIQIPAGGTMYLSVCFLPMEQRNYHGRISAVFGEDSTVMTVTGSGVVLAPAEKITQYDLRVEKVSGRNFAFGVDLLEPTSIEHTVSDALGKTVKSYTQGELKSAGRYHFTFAGMDGNDQPLPPGKYFVKLIAQGFKSTKTIELESAAVAPAMPKAKKAPRSKPSKKK